MKRNAIFLTCVLCAALMFNGCVFKRLERDVTIIESLKPISGVVINEAAHPKPVTVVLWALGDEPAEANGYWVVHQDGKFKFRRPYGRYYLLAFEDANEDTKYQEDEYTAAYGEPTIIDLDSGESFENLELRLMPPGHVKIPASISGMSVEERQEKFVWRKEQTGIVTTLDNPDFTMKNAALGLWEPVAFFKQCGMKLYFLEPYDPKKIPVLFVHGSSGYPGIWKDIIANMDRERFQPWVAFYPSGLRLSTPANAYSKYIEELRLKHQFKDLIVVAHSMGGLVSRSMIQQYANQDVRCNIPLYITLATPWQGHAGAAMGVKRAPTVIPAWYDMVPNSPFIEGIFEAPLPKETDYYLVFAHQGKPGAKFSGENTDGTVTLSSQLFMQAQEEAARVVGIDATHVSILSDTNTIRKLNQLLEQHGRK